MKRDIEALKSAEFDVVIIGGGITGACLAHDAALRGMTVALVEKNDFGMSTSAASSKLLHGGIRYLQKLQFGKVRESARERSCFQIIAPHITTNIPFLIPTIKGSLMSGRLALTAGMWLYRFICLGLNKRINDSSKKVPFGKLYNKNQAVEFVPLLGNIFGISGAYTLFETHMNNSERMTLEFIKTAVENDAVVANHVDVQDFTIHNRKVSGITCHDKLGDKSFHISAKVVVNAAGPFLPGLNDRIAGLNLHKNTTGFSKGVHLVTRQIEEKYAMALSSGKKTEGIVTRGGRHIFIIPWRGRSLIGTTNVPFNNDLDDVTVTHKDIDDFLDDINAIAPGISLYKSDIYYAFTGLYPLISDDIKTDTYQGTGEYQVVDHASQDNIAGIVSVLGAKYTTARAIAEQAVDVIADKLEQPCMPCKTATYPLSGGNITDIDRFITEKQHRYGNLLTSDTICQLVVSYGSNFERVVTYMQEEEGYLEKLSEERETLVGEIAWAVEHEMACTLEDVVIARTGLGTIGYPGTDVIQRVSKMMADLLGWPEEKRTDEVKKLNRRYECLESMQS